MDLRLHGFAAFRRAAWLAMGMGVVGLAGGVQVSASGPCQGAPLALNPVWSDGVISDGVGPAGIVVTDIDGDGRQEILSATTFSPFVLRKSTSGYATVWIGPVVGPTAVTAGDLDGDGVQEIVVGTQEGRIDIFRGDSFAPESGFLVRPGSGAPSAITGLALGKVDGTGAMDIVAATQDSTFVYAGSTLALEWEAVGKGGTGVAIGDLEGDGPPEIVVNATVGHILDAVHRVEKWGYLGGFGPSMDVGDVDGDGKAEIAFVAGWDGISVFDADTQTVKWHLSTFDPYRAKIGDVNGDGVGEVLLGDGQWGAVHAYRGSDGTELGSVQNPEHGVFGIATGDCDGDGVIEVVWGAGLSSSGKDALMVGDVLTGTLKWNGQDLDGPFRVAAGDLDGDGTMDIVSASASTNSGYNGGIAMVFNGRTRQLEWSTPPTTWAFASNVAVTVGQLDDDPALELLVAGGSYNALLTSYDGATHEVEWTSPAIGQGSLVKVSAKDVDGDGKDEIIAAMSDQRMYVLAGASNIIKWQSTVLNGYIQDFSTGDANGDGVLDLAVLTSTNLYLFRTDTWAQTVAVPMTDADRVTISRGQSQGPGQILYSHYGPTWGAKILTALDGATWQPIWDYSLGAVTVSELSSQDVDGDGQPEILVAGNADSSAYYTGKSLLLVGSQESGPSFCARWQSSDIWGGLYNAVAADLNGDGYQEILVGAYSGAQIWDTAPAAGTCTLDVTASATPASGLAPLAVNFSAGRDLSGCAWSPSYSWDFGDGSTSTDQNIDHTYYQVGTYQWTLHAAGYLETSRRRGTIEATNPPCSVTCSAYVDTRQGIAPLAVNFWGNATPDFCSGVPAFHWDFGDGGTADTYHASHTYTSAGSYDAILTVTVGGAACTETVNIQVTSLDCTLTCTAVSSTDAGPAPLAVGFSVAAQQSNCSEPLAYAWTFGDGATSSSAVPFHTYTQLGSYHWAVTVTAGAESCTESGTVTAQRPLSISTVSKQSGPLRLVITGTGLDAQPGVFIGGAQTAWAQVTYKSASKIILGDGSALKAAFPKGQPVTILLKNTDGGTASIVYTMH